MRKQPHVAKTRGRLHLSKRGGTNRMHKSSGRLPAAAEQYLALHFKQEGRELRVREDARLRCTQEDVVALLRKHRKLQSEPPKQLLAWQRR